MIAIFSHFCFFEFRASTRLISRAVSMIQIAIWSHASVRNTETADPCHIPVEHNLDMSKFPSSADLQNVSKFFVGDWELSQGAHPLLEGMSPPETTGNTHDNCSGR